MGVTQGIEMFQGGCDERLVVHVSLLDEIGVKTERANYTAGKFKSAMRIFLPSNSGYYFRMVA
jgi:hypothetical protein